MAMKSRTLECPEESQAVESDGRIVLAHGGGGELTSRLIQEELLPRIGNPILSPLTDGAIVPWEKNGAVVFTTDSYVITPLEFPGGDIGRLAVCGTVNDLAVMGAIPLALSLGLILEEGLPISQFKRIISSIAESAREAKVPVVTGDTKVIERRGEGGMFINTAGIGRLRPGVRLDVGRIEVGDAILVSGPLAEHGLAIMSLRAGMEFESSLRSDARPLADLVEAALSSGADVRFMRDATRGGLAGVLADVCETTGLSLEIEEAALPVRPAARYAAEMLGLDPMGVANEGKIVFIVARRDADRALAALRSHADGRGAAVIGRVTGAGPALVELRTHSGGRRIVQRPYGEELPRIC